MMTLRREDLLLAGASLVLGLGGGAAFAAYRAVSASGDSSRAAAFASNLAWPGVLIVLAVAAVVWFGWKAELD